MNAALHAIGFWLLDFGVLASVVMLAALALRLLVRQPTTRVAIGWGTWLGIAALAVVTALPAWPRLELTELWRQRVAEVALPPADLWALPPVVVYASPESDLPRTIAATDADPEPSVAWPSLSPPQWLAAAWLMAAAATLVWIALGLVQTQRLLRRATQAPAWVIDELQRVVGSAAVGPAGPAGLGIRDDVDSRRKIPPGRRDLQGRRHLPKILASRRVASAVALGALKPKIVLPAQSVRQDNIPAVRAALAHEWAHIRHGDLWLLLIERLLAPLLAAHPLFWWLRRDVRLDQEIVADNAAAGDDPIEYADALLAWAKQSQTTPAGLAALSLWESPHTLSRRIAMLVSPHRSAAAPSRGWEIAVLAGLLAFVAGLSLLTLRPAVADDEDRRKEPSAPAATPTTTAPLSPLPPEPLAAADKSGSVVMQFTVATIDRGKLADLDLKKMILKPGTARVRSDKLLTADMDPDEADKVLKELVDGKAAEVISRPQVQTLNNQRGYIQVGQRVPLLKAVDPATGAEDWVVEDVGTIIEATPVLLYPSPNARPEMVKLNLVIKHSELARDQDDAEPTRVVGSSAQVAITVPLERTALVAEQGGSETEAAIIVFVRPFFVSSPAANALPGPSSSRASPEETLRALQAVETYLQSSRDNDAQVDADSRRRLQELRRQIDRLLDAQAITREQPEFVVFALRHNAAEVVKRKLDAKLAEAEMADVRINADPRINCLYVFAPPQRRAKVEAWIAELDQPRSAAQTTRRAGGDSQTPPATPAQPALPVRGQRFLASFTFPQSMPADQAMFAIKQALSAIEGVEVERISMRLDERTNSLIIEGDAQVMGTVSKVVEDVKGQSAAPRRALQEDRLGDSVNSESGLTGQLALDERNFNLAPLVDRQTQIKLIEVELQVAQLNLKAAENEFERVKQLDQRKLISETQFEAKRLEADRARLQLQKLQVLLEGLRKQPAPPVPAPSEPQPEALPRRR